tara:strand:+ start:1363 stop:2634 length:1272 start_codon:yes stop_codon:yes gene_type:complete
MDNTSKTFCIYPWIHQMIDTNGAVKLCCVAEDPTTKDHGKNMDVTQSNLSTLWNSDYMQNVRERLLEGKQVKDCGQCYRKERRGEYSFRQRANKDWPEQVQKTMLNPTKVVDDMPQYLDVRFGNLCNLKCRMCTGIYSKILGEELKSIADKDEEFRLLAPDSAKSYTFDWYDNPNFWDDLEQYMSSVKLIYLTGGEPTLVQGNYEFLQQLVDRGYAKNISLVFNTNATNFQARFLNIVSNFHAVTLNLSIDGVGGVQEYVRFPSKWTQIQKNLDMLVEKIKSTDCKFNLVFTPTVSILNVGSFDKIIDWAYTFCTDNLSNRIRYNMQPIFLHGPVFQDMIYATQEYRNYVLQTIKQVDANKINYFENLPTFVSEVIDTMENKFEDPETAKFHRKQLFKWNTEIDKKRGTDITNFIEYSNLIYE